jgi:F-type H+-transporting ATPase subunit epsilon
MGFQLKVITPNGEFFQGEVEKVKVKTAMGYIVVLPRHIPLVAPVEISKLYIHQAEEMQECAIAGGVLYVEANQTRILANACECRDQIDIQRAEAAAERARERLSSRGENIDIARAEAALLRAINRLSVARGDKD